MDDRVLLEETIRMTLRTAPQGLTEEHLENYVVGTIGKKRNPAVVDPVEVKVYETALNHLLQRNIIERVELTVEGYGLGEKNKVLGYKLH
ncbi:hypothetical protein HYT55_05405 [Candidatus Woesearchaeota archaeon]|nr:hypothetical protein [Candidatus Woesearchaeota archaeon]